MVVASIFLFLVVGLILVGLGSYWHVKGKSTLSWSSVLGQIVDSSITTKQSRSNAYTLRVRYTYDTDGYLQTGERIAYGYHGGAGYSENHLMMERLSAGSHVKVYYNPRSPDQSVLVCGPTRSSISFFIFGLLWLIMLASFLLICSVGRETKPSIVSRIEVIKTGRD